MVHDFGGALQCKGVPIVYIYIYIENLPTNVFFFLGPQGPRPPPGSVPISMANMLVF